MPADTGMEQYRRKAGGEDDDDEGMNVVGDSSDGEEADDAEESGGEGLGSDEDAGADEDDGGAEPAGAGSSGSGTKSAGGSGKAKGHSKEAAGAKRPAKKLSSRAIAKEAAAAAAKDGDATISGKRFRDDNLYISHIRDGSNRDDAFEEDTKRAELQSAIIDLTGEDRDGE